MPKIHNNLKVGLDEDLSEVLQRLEPNYSSHRLLRKSVDARRSRDPHFVYSVEIFNKGEAVSSPQFDIEPIQSSEKPIIVGSGPAGLFAAIRLVERGISCVLLERGSEAKQRMKSINRHWRYGELNSEDNVCFGEGGAGLYSDGKLITRIKSPHISYVMNRLVKFGAPAEIEYLANPHVGSDRIRRVIPFIREYLIKNGCEVHFNCKMTDLITDQDKKITGVKVEDGREFHSPFVVLATGHSAEDIFDVLKNHDVSMEGKSFAMGLRIEHPQKLINQLQYRAAAEHPTLGAANYKITHHDHEKNTGVYSFCMCPGGYVISSGTEADGVVCNGMSNYHRNGAFANAAIVVSIDHDEWFKSENTFAGLDYRRKLEKNLFTEIKKSGGSKEIPSQSIKDFLKNKKGDALKSSSPSGVIGINLAQFIPEKIHSSICTALEAFEKRMPGFAGDQAQFHGIESRTSCPVRVVRDKESLQSLSHAGLYPTGEGAGYAGGITSAAVDGVKVAEAIVGVLQPQNL